MKKLKEIFSTCMVWIGFLFFTDFCQFFGWLMMKYPKWESVNYGIYQTFEALGQKIVDKFIHNSPKYRWEKEQVINELQNNLWWNR